MGNLHRVQSALQTSEDFASEAPCFLPLQSPAGHCLPDSNTAAVPGITKFPLAWSKPLRFGCCFHKQVRDAACCSSKTSFPSQCAKWLPTPLQNGPRAAAAQGTARTWVRADLQSQLKLVFQQQPVPCHAQHTSRQRCFCKYPTANGQWRPLPRQSCPTIFPL